MDDFAGDWHLVGPGGVDRRPAYRHLTREIHDQGTGLDIHFL